MVELYKLADGRWLDEATLYWEFIEATEQIEKFEILKRAIVEQTIKTES